MKHKTICIHQPNTFPRLKVLQKICQSDIWIIFDDVQYVRREWQNRCILRNLKNIEHSFWLTIPVQKAPRNEIIKNIKIHDKNTQINKIKKVIFNTYKNSEYFNWIEEYINNVLNNFESNNLADFNVIMVLELFKLLKIDRQILYSSNLNVSGKNNQKLINLCKKIYCNKYISGEGSKSYLNENMFKEKNIEIIYHQWNEDNYSIYYNINNMKNISFIDFIARFGHHELKNLLLNYLN